MISQPDDEAGPHRGRQSSDGVAEEFEELQRREGRAQPQLMAQHHGVDLPAKKCLECLTSSHFKMSY
jgi:hypothetical protein